MKLQNEATVQGTAGSQKVIVTKSRHFRKDNIFILTVIKGQYIEKLEVIGQRNLDHDLGYYRAIGYKVSGDVKPGIANGLS